MCWVEVDGKEIPWEEYDKMQQAKKQKEWRELQEQTQQALKLLGELGRAFTAFNQFLEDHPKVDLKIDLKAPTEESGDKRVYEQLKQRLGLADEAPRCMHVKADGIRCGSPRMKDAELCFAHQRMAQSQSLQQRLRNIEDANGVQMALSEVMAAVDAERIPEKKGRLLLYGLQTAMANAKHVTFHKSPKEMVTEETPVSRREAKSDEPRMNANSRELETEHMRASQPGQEAPMLITADERYRYENLDSDLRLELIEWGAKVDRRWLEKQKALANGREVETAA